MSYVCINTHTQWNINIFSHKKEEILPFAMPWVELEGVRLSKISQTEKDKYYMILLICGI